MRHLLAPLLLSLSIAGGPAVAEEPEEKPPERPRSIEPAPPRAEGEGPFDRLILRGVTVIDCTAAPAFGPVDLIIEGNRISRLVTVGAPGRIDPEARPEAGPGDRELDLEGHFVLPGFVDMHGHIGGVQQGTPAEYVFKLWMAHGITTVRDPGSGNGLRWTLEHSERSAANAITAPRIHPYVFFGQGRDAPFTATDEVRRWVAEVAAAGAQGIKFFGARPDLMQAALDEAGRRGLRTTCHHAQLAVTRMNVLDTARWGLSSMEHWYGLPEALFTDRTVQHYPPGYNYMDEQHRFAEAGRLWAQAASPGSPRWNEVMEELLAHDFTINPTLNIYEANRDLMRAYRAEWHEEYTLPSLWDFFAPSRLAHGSYWFHWTTADEIAWRDNYRRWMAFLDEYKNRGGRVTTGSDSGFIYQIYGFGYVRELELLQEAGFHPLEVIRAATLHGAQALGREGDIGSIEPGKLADLVIVGANPLENLKMLYGTGTLALGEDDVPTRLGGVVYTVKDGILYDAPGLLADVRRMVREAREEAGRPRLEIPGWPDLESVAAPEAPAQ
jgi:hypothetical protein